MWKNAYIHLSVKNTIASGALRWALDPVNMCLLCSWNSTLVYCTLKQLWSESGNISSLLYRRRHVQLPETLKSAIWQLNGKQKITMTNICLEKQLYLL